MKDGACSDNHKFLNMKQFQLRQELFTLLLFQQGKFLAVEDSYELKVDEPHVLFFWLLLHKSFQNIVS